MKERLRPLFFAHKFIVNASNLIYCKHLHNDTVADILCLEVEVKKLIKEKEDGSSKNQ